jgi:endogenous inhibitor of DNA gyrase (YacG/DUF329 family)
MKRVRHIKCPTCGKKGDWSSGAYRPFCSQRCKLIDLGKWFGEEHLISDPLRPEHVGQFADLPASGHLDEPEKKMSGQ